jgi:SPP1 gp7 family putative phage head morphogenesis protein
MEDYMVKNLNNFMLQLDYRTPFNAEENSYYQHIAEGINNQLTMTIQYLKSPEAKEFYNERAEYLEYLWEQYDLSSQLDGVINYNSSSCDEFMDNFYHSGAKVGYEQLKRGLAFTPADEQTLNFIRLNNYGYVKKLNYDVTGEIQKTIFEDIVQGNSYQKTITKLRELPRKPFQSVETGVSTLSPDMRARFIARTERARARNFGTLQSYANYGVEEYDVMTAGDSRVCNTCISIEEGNPYRLSDSRGYPPFHPNCRCGVAPHIGDTPLSNTPVDFPVSVSEYVDITMNPNRL